MKRRERRRRIEASQELIITSMVDMFTLLLTFLLNFVNPSSSTADDVLLPDSTSAEAVGAGVVLAVNAERVTVDGQVVLTLEGDPTDPRVPAGALAADGSIPELGDALARALDNQPVARSSDSPDAALVVQCDRSLPYALVSELLLSARGAGFHHFRLVVNGSGG